MESCSVGVLGLDALSYEYLTKIAESGYAPTLKYLMSHGFAYTLRALEPVPPLTPTSWASILTGVNPGKHGVPGFCDREGRLVTAERLEHPRVCEMVALNGRSSVIINPIPEYPLYALRGCHALSHGFFAPRPLCNSDLLARYLDSAPSPDLKYSYNDCRVAAVQREQYEYYLGIVEEVVERVDGLALLWVNLDYPDNYLHVCPSAVPKCGRVGVRSEEVAVVRVIDRIARVLLESLDVVIVVSDHGFSRYDKTIYLNSFLRLKGYVEVTRERSRAPSLPEPLERAERRLVKVRVSQRARRMVRALHLGGLASAALRLLRRLNVNVKVERGLFVDRVKSKAYMPFSSYMGLVVKGDWLIGQVIGDLKGLEGVLVAKKGSEYAWGPYASRLPDVVVLPDFFRGYLISDEVGENEVVRERAAVWHHPDGVFLIGPSSRLHCADVHPSKAGSVLKPYVVANVILPLLGMPVSHVADGVNEARMVLGENVIITERNYTSKWRVIKRARALRGARPRAA